MSDASFASLNPALLARKGGAKPAMRPQVAPLPHDAAAVAALGEEKLEDLGWNDMGSDDEGQAANEGADVVSITGKAANEDVSDADSPVVRRQQKDLSERVLADAAMPVHVDEKPAPKSKKSSRKKKQKSAASKGKRAAFTLRLDTDRHLKLRLASTMKGVSAQALVTDALDAMLEQFEELDALAERMKRD